MTGSTANWPLWEVFVRPKRGVSHVHSGTVHAPDAELALQNARDLFTRRSEGVSIWVVKSADITASDPSDREAMFYQPVSPEEPGRSASEAVP